MQMRYSTRRNVSTAYKTRAIALPGRRVLLMGSLGLAVGFFAMGCGKPFKSMQRVSLTADVPSQRLRIVGTIGDITVRAEPGAKAVKAIITKVTRGSNQARADEALDEIQVSFEMQDKKGTTVLAKSSHPRGSGTASYAVRWEVTVPPELTVVIETSIGDVRVEGCTGEVSVAGGIGNIVIVGAKGSGASLGPVTITNEVGDVRVDHVTSELRASAGIGGIRASASGKVDLKTSVGDVRLKLLQGSSADVQLRTSIGDIYVAIPDGWKGKVLADADIGSTSAHLGSLFMGSLRQRRHHFTADLGDASQPVLQAMTEVGDVYLRTYEP